MNLRLAIPDKDFPAIVDLINPYEPVPVSLEQFHKYHECMPEGRICRRMVAVDAQDQVAGYSYISHETWHPEGRFYVWVVVAPPSLRKGIGAALAADAQAFLQEQAATSLACEVRDDDPVSLSFAQRFGFAIDRHQFCSVLDLSTFDETPFAGLIAGLQANGICFFSLADVGDTQAARRKLYEVNYTTALDLPGSTGDWLTFEQFEEQICGADWYRPAGQLVAAAGEEYIGLSAVHLVPEEQLAYNEMTGVLRSYRGRKIAQALKLLAIGYARQSGARYFRTQNNSLNVPILAINRKLGYQPLPGMLILQTSRP